MARILVLEDDPNQSMLMTDTLEAGGHEAVLTHRVADAERVLAQVDIDLAILDMKLPDGSGLEVIRSMRATPRLAQTPIIVVTASSQLRKQAEDLGADLFLLKPVDVIALQTLVRRLVGGGL